MTADLAHDLQAIPSRPASPVAPGCLVAVTTTARVDANGTAWRLRSLVAMGHDCARIARALGVPPEMVRRVVNGQASTVTARFRAAAIRLWDAWWDKTPPARSPAQKRAATRALYLARQRRWPAAAGLDDDELDTPGYRPWCGYRPATGTGIAPDFSLAQPTNLGRHGQASDLRRPA
ncbi:MAG TPA: hypothetical protein VNF47_01815 [Streptosporangiaceae bacterium]|nr:hypothetical protein [Streptosporangiaceae bacterium]